MLVLGVHDGGPDATDHDIRRLRIGRYSMKPAIPNDSAPFHSRSGMFPQKAQYRFVNLDPMDMFPGTGL